MENATDRAKVLVVEDDELTRKMFSETLGKKYEVLTAADAEDGMRLFVEHNPVAVVLDVVLPGRDGLTSLKFIRSMNRDTCVIMITGYAKVEYLKTAFTNGANYFLEKPVSPDELRRTVDLGVENVTQELRRHQVFNEMTVMVNDLNSTARKCQELQAKMEAALHLAHDLKQGLLQIGEDLAKAAEASGVLSPARLSLDICMQQADLHERLSVPASKAKQQTLSAGNFVQDVARSMVPDAKARQVAFDIRFRTGSGLVKTRRDLLEPAVRVVLGRAIQAASTSARSVRLLGLEYPGFFEFRLEYLPANAQRGSVAQEDDLLKEQGFALAALAIGQIGGQLRIQHKPDSLAVVSCRIPLQPA